MAENKNTVDLSTTEQDRNVMLEIMELDDEDLDAPVGGMNVNFNCVQCWEFPHPH